MTVVLRLHKFSLQANIDQGQSMYSDHLVASINCCKPPPPPKKKKKKKKNYCNDSKITEFEMIDTKHSSTAYVVLYKLITWWFSD